MKPLLIAMIAACVLITGCGLLSGDGAPEATRSVIADTTYFVYPVLYLGHRENWTFGLFDGEWHKWQPGGVYGSGPFNWLEVGASLQLILPQGAEERIPEVLDLVGSRGDSITLAILDESNWGWGDGKVSFVVVPREYRGSALGDGNGWPVSEGVPLIDWIQWYDRTDGLFEGVYPSVQYQAFRMGERGTAPVTRTGLSD